MTSSVVFDVSVAITRGALLVAQTHSVGPYRVMVPSEEQTRWACLDRSGKPVGASVVAETMRPALGVPHPFAVLTMRPHQEEHDDWSAFAAAKAFVEAVGEPAAQRALKRMASERSTAERRVGAAHVQQAARRRER